MIKNNTNQRPKFLNLLQIRLPVTAVASILHRVSGAILFLVLPVIIYGLGLSLQGVEGFKQVQQVITLPVCQFLISLVVTLLFYHLLAGMRFLLLDLDVGYNLPIARWSARLVIILSMVLFVLLNSKVFAI